MRNVSVLLLLLFSYSSFAADKKLPDKMTGVDAARWDAALAHEQLFAEQIAPYEKTINDLCKAYAIDRAALGRTVATPLIP